MKAPRLSKRAPRRAKPASTEAQLAAFWETSDGYRLSDRLLALNPSGQSGNLVIGLASEILERQVRKGRRGLAVCGAARGAGVTFVAANLAVALAQLGVSTLLVDVNLGGAGLERLIVPPNPGPGLGDLLADPAVRLEDAVRREVIPNLSVLYAGAGWENEADALASDAFREIVRRCLRDHEFTLFDTPPANRSAGARLVSGAAGYALLVAARNASFTEDMGTLTNQLADDDVKIIGSVLNRA